MKGVIKGLLSAFSISILLLGNLTVTISAESNFDVVEAKRALAEKHENDYLSLSSEQVQNRSKEIDKILLQLYAGSQSSEAIEEVMQRYKVYKLKVPSGYEIDPTSIPTDAGCNAASIYLDAATQEWIVVGGGWWNNENWFDDGILGNVGGLDSVGIEFNGTYGSYDGVNVISSYGYMTDHHGTSITSEYPSHGNGQYGAAFDFQDYVHILSDTYAYFGDGYSALIRYNSNFANYHGNARVFYAHTWNSTTINNISFGLSGIQIEFSSTNNRWTIFNTGDTQF